MTSELSGKAGPCTKSLNSFHGNRASIVIYGYVPSLALGALGVALYGVLFAAHLTYFVLKRGTRWFQGLLWFGALLEVAGYVLRILSNGKLCSVHPRLPSLTFARVTSRQTVRGQLFRCSVLFDRCGKLLRFSRCKQNILSDVFLVRLPFSSRPALCVRHLRVQRLYMLIPASFLQYLALSDALNRLPLDTKTRLVGFKTKIFVIIFIVFDVITTIVQIA